MSASTRIGHTILRSALVALLLSTACGEQPLEPAQADARASVLEDAGDGDVQDKALAATYQAENSSQRSGCQVIAAQASLPSYADYGGIGSWVEWNNVRVDRPGRYQLTFRHANGAANARPCDASVNGKKFAQVAFDRTGSWSRWSTVSVEVDLVAGNNTVRLTASTSVGGPNLDWMSVSRATRGLYTWNFGGLEQLSAVDAVTLLRGYGYAGIVIDTSDPAQLPSYLAASENTPDFEVVAAYVALQLHRGERFSDARHRAAIDAISQAGQGDLWLTFRDDNGTQTRQAITQLVRSIVAYAKTKGVRVICYPHDKNVFATTAQAMTIVREINQPNFGVALNLIHELRAGNSSTDALKSSFAAAGDKLFAVTMSGAAQDRTTIKALHESAYDLRPFIQLIKQSGFGGPVGFLNHTLTRPRTYLPASLGYFREQW